MSVDWTTVGVLSAVVEEKSRRAKTYGDVPAVSAVGRKVGVAKFNIAGGPSSGAS